MVVKLKKGLSIDNVAQGKVIEKLFKGEYDDAFRAFNNSNRTQLKEVATNYSTLLTKYDKYYKKHKKAKRVLSNFVDTIKDLSEGKDALRPTKKYDIKYTFADKEPKPVEPPPEDQKPTDKPNEDQKPDSKPGLVRSKPDEVEVEVTNTGDVKFTEETVKDVPVTKKPEEKEKKPMADRVEGMATESILAVPKVSEQKTPPVVSSGVEQKASVKKIGLLGPHGKNTTEKAVREAIGESIEDQIRDFENWFVFDIPDSYTGTGNAKVNPMVKNNETLQKMDGEGELMKVSLTEYLLTEGVEEIKDFYNNHPALLKAAFKRDMEKRHMEKTEAEFLAQFDSKSNGLFSQDQTTAERNNWRNIYQVPSGSYRMPDEYPLTEPIDHSIFVDYEITRNKNDFPDKDVSY